MMISREGEPDRDSLTSLMEIGTVTEEEMLKKNIGGGK
jgi:hypothetical protein